MLEKLKIAVFVPLSTIYYEDDTSTLIRGLEANGVEVIKLLLSNNSYSVGGNYTVKDLKTVDLIWAPYEPLIILAAYLKKRIDKPVAGHYEQVPPGRVSFDDIYKHAISSVDEYSNEKYDFYRACAQAFNDCEIKTTTDDYTFNRIEFLLGKKIRGNIGVKPYPVDFEKVLNNTVAATEKYQIVSSMRLIDHKRHHHVISALSKMNNPPKYVLIGDGPELSNIKKMAVDCGVEVEFTGLVTDKERDRIVQESMFTVYPWAWLGVGEAAAFGKASICYYRPDTYNRLGELPYYVENENINELSIAIQKLCSDKALRDNTGQKAKYLLENGGCLTMSHVDAGRLLKDFFINELERMRK